MKRQDVLSCNLYTGYAMQGVSAKYDAFNILAWWFFVARFGAPGVTVIIPPELSAMPPRAAS